MNAKAEYRYKRLTWPEMNEAMAMQKVVTLPSATEQHEGPVQDTSRW